MRRRRAVPEAIGLSVLDLMCGFLGLLIVLYATTARVDGSPGVEALPLKFIRIQLDDTIVANVGLEVTVGGEHFKSWPDCIDAGPITWASCDASVVEGLVKSADSIDDVRFLLLDPPETTSGDIVFNAVQLWVTTPEEGKLCTVDFSTIYRGALSEATQCP